jgi:hypothetical protein
MNVKAQGAQIFVDPAENIFYTDTTSVGTEFTVDVMAVDWVDPGVLGYEFKLSYDNTMLEAVAAAIPDGHWLTPEGAPTSFFPVDSGTINHAEGLVSFAATLLSPEPGKTGGGVIATITLQITAAPALGETLECDLAIVEAILVDPTATEIPPASYDNIPGIYQYISPPPPSPYLAASSKGWDEAAAEAAGRVFEITITIHDVLPDWHLVGIQFELQFNSTLINTSEEEILEGDFLSYFGETYFVAKMDTDNVIAGQLQLPPWPGPHGWANGSGVVATIQFHAVHSAPPAASCDLTLTDKCILVDDVGELIPIDRLEHGLYQITVAPPPYLSLNPQTATLDTIGETLDLNVGVNDLDAGFMMVGAEFKVYYDTSLFSITETDISEGTDNIMREVADRTETDLFFQAYVDDSYGLVGIIILPLPNGTWPYYPEGTGTLAQLTFTLLNQDPTQVMTTEITLDEALLVDSNAKPIPLDEVTTA